MKIVRKTEFYPSVEIIYQGYNNNTSGEYVTIELCSCYSITGKFKAVSSLEFMNTGEPESRIIYFPNYEDPKYVTDETFDPDQTSPEINFRLYPNEPQPAKGYSKEIYDKMNEPITIPPNTGSIFLEIAPGDSVAIWARTVESYAIIDDDGNEIPLDSLIGNSSCNKSETS